MNERLKELLEAEVLKRNSVFELSYDNPDPLLIASRYKNEKVALICALFAYGKASAIVRFLDSLDFSALSDPDRIERMSRKYRFQNESDVRAIFFALSRIDSLEEIFLEGYKKRKDVLDGIGALIKEIKRRYPHDSHGYDFLIGRVPSGKNGSPYKRWNMFLRWMVRKDNLDMGLWKGVDKADLIIPLDTHTFNVSRKLGLLQRKSYDLKAALELTANLKKFDPSDPVKYDFALYRLGQSGIV